MITRSTGLAGAALVVAACSSDAESSTASSSTASTADSPTSSGAIDTSGLGDGPLAVVDPATIPRGQEIDFGPAPDFPEGALSAEAAAAVALVYGRPLTSRLTPDALEAITTIGASGDARLAWLLSDHIRVNLRLAQSQGWTEDEFFAVNGALEAAAGQLTGQQFPELMSWNPLTNALIGWDTVSYTHLTLPTIYSV